MDPVSPRARSWWAVAVAATAHAAWPPFLPPPETFPPGVVEDVDRIWRQPTLSRTVDGRSAAVPLQTYLIFVDVPEVTAAAARFLKLAKYEVRALDADFYAADDHEGTRGSYRVLVRESGRRVILSRGEHHGRLLGTVRGSALTVLDFEGRDGRVDQRLAAHVLIDSPALARLARLLAPLFGWLADRKLGEAFAVTAKVAEWAVERPAEFCEWIERQPIPALRRERVASALLACGRAPALTSPYP